MGPIGHVFSMLRGFGAELMPKGHEKESEANIKRYMTMMDSMTNECKLLTFAGINLNFGCLNSLLMHCRGSGRQVKAVMEMVEEYKRLAKIWGKIKGFKMPKKEDMSALSRNMNMGGGLQNLMKQMVSGKDMMGMFGGGR
ncbi:hypothetical protein M9H77_34601 [Catharanthus roseus]|uniref:Uncharacterized protein n=1 Tax=Catharanthus roseus TaxID=4058 RepID=A0ACB9ZP58_CATRO|nr:hypothetical protein M9H77_34601 [Catharanthus roseus]